MNAVLTLPSQPGLLDRYNRLPLGQKLVLRLKSLLRPASGHGEFVECLKATGVRTPSGKAWTAPLVSAMQDQLRQAGLLTREAACLPELIHDIAVEAATSPEASALAAAIHAEIKTEIEIALGGLRIRRATADCSPFARYSAWFKGSKPRHAALSPSCAIRASEPFATACVALAEYAIDPALSLAHQDELARQFDRPAMRCR